MTNETRTVTYDIEEPPQTSGCQCYVYLIPGEERDGNPHVCTWWIVGAGIAMAAFHRRWHCLGRVPLTMVADDLLEVLKSQESTLLAIDDAYDGTEDDEDTVELPEVSLDCACYADSEIREHSEICEHSEIREHISTLRGLIDTVDGCPRQGDELGEALFGVLSFLESHVDAGRCL